MFGIGNKRLRRQISELEGQVDTLNVEVVKLMRLNHKLREQLEGYKDRDAFEEVRKTIIDDHLYEAGQWLVNIRHTLSTMLPTTKRLQATTMVNQLLQVLPKKLDDIDAHTRAKIRAKLPPLKK